LQAVDFLLFASTSSETEKLRFWCDLWSHGHLFAPNSHKFIQQKVAIQTKAVISKNTLFAVEMQTKEMFQASHSQPTHRQASPS
jgi:hypothetical protein